MTSDLQSKFKTQGYLVFDELFAPAQIDRLRNAAEKIVENFDAESHKSIFSTKNENVVRDNYFLDSGDKVRCFFEEDAFDTNGNLVVDKALSINKIGHALHNKEAVFNAFSRQNKLADIATELGCESPEIRQSMYIFKQAKIGGEVRWHQDATYFFTQPQSVLTFWFALEDATLQNGCLQVMENGAHFPIKEQFKRYIDDRTELINIKEIDWPNNDQAIPLEVKKGSLVVFNGNLPHFSAPNTSDKSRHAFTLHITSGKSTYSKYNWLQTEGLSI